jgi:hypothetical protein
VGSSTPRLVSHRPQRRGFLVQVNLAHRDDLRGSSCPWSGSTPGPAIAAASRQSIETTRLVRIGRGEPDGTADPAMMPTGLEKNGSPFPNFYFCLPTLSELFRSLRAFGPKILRDRSGEWPVDFRNRKSPSARQRKETHITDNKGFIYLRHDNSKRFSLRARGDAISGYTD